MSMVEQTAFEIWADECRPRIEARLSAGLSVFDGHVVDLKSPLVKAMRHGVMNGGKRVRGLAVLAAGRAFGASDGVLLEVAAALEYVHAYSLIHDDLPCMDDDDLRRGQPTVHVVYGEAMALLAGDALQTLAFSTLSAVDLNVNASVQIELLRELSAAAGTAGMGGGQAIDCHHVNRELSLDDMRHMHQLKTGALLSASFIMGALCGDVPVVQRADLKSFADKLGLLFQVVDDILDATQNSETLGKTAGKDADANKPTYVRAMGLVCAQAYASRLHHEAAVHLKDFGLMQSQQMLDLLDYCFSRIN